MHLPHLILPEGARYGRSGQVSLGHRPFQLVDLRMEHQEKLFMGCDYNIDMVYPLQVKITQAFRIVYEIPATHVGIRR